MRRVLFAAALLAIGCLGGIAVKNLEAPAGAQGAMVVTYEYQTVDLPARIDKVNSQLNDLGRAGWHVVSSYAPNAGFTRVILERAKTAEPAPAPAPTPSGS